MKRSQDLIRFSARKNAEDLKKSLETVVTPVFCSAHSTADDEKKQKLVKVSDNEYCIFTPRVTVFFTKGMNS